MGQVFDALDDRLTDFIRDQHVFFVATAPLAAGGLLNLSPKGLDTFSVLGERRVAYLDLTGSGVETMAHLGENGRIVIMFCAFEGRPRILRLHGRGRAVVAGDTRFEELSRCFPPRPGVRSVVEVDVTRIADSCGFGVPLMDHRGDRRQLDSWAEAKGPDGLAAYRAKKNAVSLDGLPGLPS